MGEATVLTELATEEKQSRRQVIGAADEVFGTLFSLNRKEKCLYSQATIEVKEMARR
jgi:hypothetical protein